MNKEAAQKYVEWLNNRITSARYGMDSALSDGSYFEATGREEAFQEAQAKFLSLQKETDNEQ